MQLNEIIQKLRKEYGNPRTALAYRNKLQLLISTMLSAQCTDKRVNEVCKELYKKYKTAKDFATVDIAELEQDIKPTGFYRQKAKFIQGACRKLVSDFKGKVPDNMEDLLTLPGVARKTANVVLQNAFDKVEGFVVDTHVKRVSQRLGFHDLKDPEKIEQVLMEKIPKKEWMFMDHALIEHGRALCVARKPKCPSCFLKDNCPSSKKLIKEFWS